MTTKSKRDQFTLFETSVPIKGMIKRIKE
jgi:hypothetical protein